MKARVSLFLSIMQVIAVLQVSNGSDPCLIVKDGYFVNVYKEIVDEATLYPFDSYFFEKEPEFLKNTYCDSIDLLPNKMFVNVNYFMRKNLFRSMVGKNYQSYILNQHPLIKESIQEDYVVEVFQVTIVYTITSMKISDYIEESGKTHSQRISRLSQSMQTEKYLDVIFPEVIQVW